MNAVMRFGIISHIPPKKRARQTLALASFHARVLFVNNIETAATTNHLTVTIA
jgi:hypothetical protein